MAEIRKHDPAAGNAIAQALRAAMGDPVRPVTPGETRPAAGGKPDVPASTSWITLSVNAPTASKDDADEAREDD